MKKAFLDLAGRFPWPKPRLYRGAEFTAGDYGRGFRIGDRAAIHVRALQWRLANPDAYLLVLEDMSFPECQHEQELHADWLMEDIADEVVTLQPGQEIPMPEGERVYDQCLWYYWHDLRFWRPRELVPNLLPTPEGYRQCVGLLLGGLAGLQHRDDRR